MPHCLVGVWCCSLNLNLILILILHLNLQIVCQGVRHGLCDILIQFLQTCLCLVELAGTFNDVIIGEEVSIIITSVTTDIIFAIAMILAESENQVMRVRG